MRLPLLVLAALQVQAATTPDWFQALQLRPAFEGRFVQTSESSVFGQVKREGLLLVAPGGRIRVQYTKGLLVVGNGRTLTQWDPAARTAQAFLLETIARDMPLLHVLTDPAALERHYEIQVKGDTLHLRPRRKGIPEVTLEGANGRLQSLTWVDGTGARQVLRLTPDQVRHLVKGDPFAFKAPEGTRWIR